MISNFQTPSRSHSPKPEALSHSSSCGLCSSLFSLAWPWAILTAPSGTPPFTALYDLCIFDFVQLQDDRPPCRVRLDSLLQPVRAVVAETGAPLASIQSEHRSLLVDLAVEAVALGRGRSWACRSRAGSSAPSWPPSSPPTLRCPLRRTWIAPCAKSWSLS